MASGFGPMKTLVASLDDVRRAELKQGWDELAEPLRDGNGIAHPREYLLILGIRR